MPMYEIPTRSDIPAFEFSINLDNNVYYFDFKYNLRMTRWIVNILDSNKNNLLSGLVLRTDVELISQYTIENLFSGYLVVMNNDDSQTSPERNDLGNNSIFIYIN